RREGLTDHPRVVEGLRLIRDRTIESGGWNYGNKVVFGRELRPQPAPTGLGLLALAGHEDRTPAVRRAIAYLQDVLPSIRSAASLCWGLLGLRAWGHRPENAASWLEEGRQLSKKRGDTALRLSCLLLAAGTHSLKQLGLAEGDSWND
ncbi:MAG TPA: hypothetical protein VFT74_15800, partial [Isosphaeraceae bacterium]|nr:hypothetical protein [Isosphaeraceae bacterium]